MFYNKDIYDITLRVQFDDQHYNNVIICLKDVRGMKDVMKLIILVRTIYLFLLFSYYDEPCKIPVYMNI